MITVKELDEKRQALHDFVVMSNDNDNIIKKRTGVQSIKAELEQACPYVKDYEPYPDFRVMNYIQDFVLYSSHLHDVEHFVERYYDEIKEYESLDEETKKAYAAKLWEYRDTTSVHYQNKPDPHPDQIFTHYGSYRQFCSYQNNKTYLVARKMRGALEESGEGEFSLHFRAYMLYNAAVNELAIIEKTMRRTGYIIADTTVKKRDELPDGDPYADVRAFKNPNADPGIFYNFWGKELKKNQEKYAGKESLTGEQKAMILAPYNYRKFLNELVAVFQAARAEVNNTIPETTKAALEDLLTKLFNDYVERMLQENGKSFDIMLEKLDSWENRTNSAGHDAEEKVPTIVCYDSECEGETSSSCLQRHINFFIHELVHNRLQQIAFSPRFRELGIPRYDFWNGEYEKLRDQYKGKRGLPDEIRALFNQEDNSALFVKKVRVFIDSAVDECAKNGWNVSTTDMANALEQAKAFYQEQFFKFNERLEKTDLPEEDKTNAILGWLFFTKRTVSRIRWEGISYTNVPRGKPDMRGAYFTFSYTGSGAIFDEMKSRFLEDSANADKKPGYVRRGLFDPLGNMNFDLTRLYEYLHREDDRVIVVSQSDFEDAVFNGNFNQLLADGERLGTKTKIKCLIQFFKDKFPKKWYDTVSENSGISKDSLKKVNFERGPQKKFKRCIEGIPLTK